MQAHEWEDILNKLLKKAGITCYPLTSPLEANFETGHVVFTPITEAIYSSYEGEFVDSVQVSIDARAYAYTRAREVFNQSIQALSVIGFNSSRFLDEREPLNVLFDGTTDVYRFVSNLVVNPHYVILDDTGPRSFSLSFARSFA